MGSPRASAARAVVHDVSIAVRRGEAVGLLGPNGAGKTTVFTIIMGLVKPDSGEILLDGHAITRPAAVPARPAGHRLPAAGALDLSRPQRRGQHPRRARGACALRARSAGARLEELLDEFGIAHLAKVNALALSGGERRRVEIARAVAADPVFMLLDEPFAGVDPIAVADVKGLVRQLTRRGIGVLITDHSVRETLSLVDRAYLIHDGRVMIQGKPETIAADPEARRVYLGESFSV